MGEFNFETAGEILEGSLGHPHSDFENKSIFGDESKIIALIPDGEHWSQPYVIFERSFTASCSSSWGWGLTRFPTYPWKGGFVWPGGPADILHEIGYDKVAEGIDRAKNRMADEANVQPAIQCYVVTINFPGLFPNKLKVDNTVMVRLEDLHQLAKGPKLNQKGYQVVDIVGNSIIMIAEDGNYMQYLRDNLVKLGNNAGAVVAIAYGDVYYGQNGRPVGEPINRTWFHTHHKYPGKLVIDAPTLVKYNKMDFLDLWGIEMSDPKSIDGNVEDLEFFEADLTEMTPEHNWM